MQSSKKLKQADTYQENINSAAPKNGITTIRSYTLTRVTLVLLSLVLLLGGCTTLTTSKTDFPEIKEPGEEVRIDARALLEQAVKTTNESEDTQSFWFMGHIKNSIQDRTTTSMYQGVAMRPEEAYIVNGRIAAQPYQYYSWGDSKFIKRGQIWYRPKGDEEVLAFDPFGGFTDWLPFLEDAKSLPDEAILSHLSHVVEVRINAKEWIEQSPSPLFEDLKLNALSDETLNHVLENTIVKMTLWIGKADHIIYQYRTWLVMPLPGSGYFDQETFYRFYRYNDPSIPDHIQSPERVERWVLEYEEQLRTGELEGEMEQ
jgi:hypothetical protein